jgi:hypothetical protein
MFCPGTKSVHGILRIHSTSKLEFASIKSDFFEDILPVEGNDSKACVSVVCVCVCVCACVCVCVVVVYIDKRGENLQMCTQKEDCVLGCIWIFPRS